MSEDATQEAPPHRDRAEAEPVKLGSMLLHPRRAAPRARGGLQPLVRAGPLLRRLHGRALQLRRPRFVATAELKALRDPDSSAITGEPARGSYVSVYWVLDGYYDVWNEWALRQVNALHAAGRMFEERDHVHTLLYNYNWEFRRDPDGVPVELALDHPYRGFVTVFIDRAEDVTNEALWEWLRTEHLPGCCPGPTPTWWPRSRRSPSRWTRPATCPARRPATAAPAAVVPEHAARGGVGAGHRRAPAPARGEGKGTVVAALPFIPTIPGTDTYTDKLWHVERLVNS
jgi:hypothetical protein